jgi:hypothetical protein
MDKAITPEKKLRPALKPDFFRITKFLGTDSTRIPQLKLSEGQTWSSEDTGVFSFKVFLTPARSLHLLNVVTHRTDSCRLLRGRTHCLRCGRFAPCS